MMDSGADHKTFADAEAEFMRAHHDVLEDARNDVEYLDRAGCSPRVTNLARLAIGAASDGLTSGEWRTWITDALGAEAEPVLDEAEKCMRVRGLWPWPN